MKTITTHGLEVMAMPAAFLESVRSLSLDDQSQPVERRVSKLGGEPLRDRLRRAWAGEEIILASEVESKIRHFLDQTEVWFVDARFAAYGCFACRFQRAGTENTTPPLRSP